MRTLVLWILFVVLLSGILAFSSRKYRREMAVPAKKAGQYKGRIGSHALELDDCLIAATAHNRKAFLATGNGRHYPMDDVSILTVAGE